MKKCECLLIRKGPIHTIEELDGCKKDIHYIEHQKCEACAAYETARKQYIPQAEKHADKHGTKHNGNHIPEVWNALFLSKMDALWKQHVKKAAAQVQG